MLVIISYNCLLFAHYFVGTNGISWNWGCKECYWSMWQGSIQKKMYLHFFSSCFHLDFFQFRQGYWWELLEQWGILQRKQGTQIHCIQKFPVLLLFMTIYQKVPWQDHWCYLIKKLVTQSLWIFKMENSFGLH